MPKYNVAIRAHTSETYGQMNLDVNDVEAAGPIDAINRVVRRFDIDADDLLAAAARPTDE